MTGDETVPYPEDPRPCGQCGHTTTEHWTETTESFACTRSGCDCTSWFGVTAGHPITAGYPINVDDRDIGDAGDNPDGFDGGGRVPWADRPGWVGPAVVTLCGSMRSWPLMLTVATTETAAGVIVLAPFVIVPTDEQSTLGGDPVAVKVGLDALHRAKIAMSSSVLVVTDETGYWGESTRAEICCALTLGLVVRVREVDRATGAQTYRGRLTGPWGWSR